MFDRFERPFVPIQTEKDRAIQIARRILSGHYITLSPGEYETLARQYLRELALSATA